MTRKVIKQGRAPDLLEPSRISLVGKPATRAGFKILRNDSQEAETVPAKTSQDSTKIMRVEFPAGTDETTITDVIGKMGVSMVRKTSEEEETAIVMVKEGATLDGSENLTKLTLSNGVHVFVDMATMPAQRAESITGVTVCELQFPTEWEVSRVEEWLKEKDISYLEDVSRSDEEAHHVILRANPAEAELKSIAIADEVKAVIHRSEENNVPVAIYNGVVEASYGSYGWGIIDFNQYMANEEFRQGFWNASYAFREVVESIMLYSELSIDERTALLQNAIQSFSKYLTGLLQNLPKGVQVSQTEQRSESDMALSNQKKPAESVARSEESPDAAQSGTAATGETAGEQVTQTESQADTAAAAAATEGNETISRAEVKRMIEEGFAGLADTVTAKLSATLKTEVGEAIARSEENTKQTLEGLQTTLGSMQKTVEEMGGTVVVRSEEAHRSSEQHAAPADVFTGVFGGRRQ
jgi:hypothetical protein